ncbi:MAG: carboxypeptidase regulatory-like domain-containing protein [Planctomycetes bacterium]|nr:carboxypeptidase regulatory-like domain-containing protein [Planctomycetota bacterium]
MQNRYALLVVLFALFIALFFLPKQQTKPVQISDNNENALTTSVKAPGSAFSNSQTKNEEGSGQDAQTALKSEQEIERSVIITGSVLKPDATPVEGARVRISICEPAAEGKQSVKYGDSFLKETAITGSYPSTNKQGNFNTSFQYRSKESSKHILLAEVWSPFTNYNKSLQPYDREKHLELLYSDLCYVKPQTFIIAEKNNTINIILWCLPTAKLTVQIIPESTEAYLRLEIPGIPDSRYSREDFATFEGKAIFEVPADTEFNLTCRSCNYPDIKHDIEPLQTLSAKYLRLEFSKGHIRYSGNFVDENGIPIKDAGVEIIQDGLSSYRTQTDSNGSFVAEGLLDKPIRQISFTSPIKNNTNNTIEKPPTCVSGTTNSIIIFKNVDINISKTFIFEQSKSNQESTID